MDWAAKVFSANSQAIWAEAEPVGMVLAPFQRLFIFNDMARFVFRFVFSTGTCFQQLLRFVFRFVQLCFSGMIDCYQ
jgi:hypothetical protein